MRAMGALNRILMLSYCDGFDNRLRATATVLMFLGNCMTHEVHADVAKRMTHWLDKEDACAIGLRP
ncbi:MAG TPA: hypothetical protein ENI80_03465 [Acidiferrobacteraceae bacterium]|nr:hypothetical protein [Acidiferrobacteraceae bacterium]